MTDHRIIATDWQLQAAQEGRLGAVIVPLEPQPVFCDTKDCYVDRGLEWRWNTAKAIANWQQSEEVPSLVLKYLPYQVGDRIYLAEKWCKGDGARYTVDEIYFTESTTPEAENIGWKTAETMPPEAAQHWYEVAGIRVVQMLSLGFDVLDASSLFDVAGSGSTWVFESVERSANRWNAAHPVRQWDTDQWVIVLDVKEVAK